ncbi:MAG: CPBP family intramembrane metalloprotease [Oscillospiraceae bacterium]|nr:CPBP family intramembrane metalloprotease [Oscillospiraceae bacterium]
MDSYPAEIQQEILAQGVTRPLFGVVSALQSAAYGLILGAVGIWLAKKVGLWKDETNFEKKPVVAAVIVSVIGGMAMILLDVFFFGNYSDAIRDSYLVKPTPIFILGSVTYGAVIEEVMLRLFLMSGVAFLLHLIIERGKKETSSAVLIVANIISAALFAAGHLPATAMLMGLSPMILLRCFLLNGGIGLLFGWLYRRYGLRYAMLAHGGCHIVSKAIWILFL